MNEPTTRPEFELHCPLSEKTALQLQFESFGDLFAHRLAASTGNESFTLLESIDGPHDKGPPSPPLQELVREVHDGCQTLLGVGMSGRSHWSVAFQCIDDGGIRGDYACRMASWMPIGCLWRVGRNCDFDVTDDRILFTVNGLRLELESPNARWSLNRDQCRLLLTADTNEEARYPSTVQWGWSVRLADLRP
ncbi:MAG: hypothetical protein ACR2NP_19850 [Pirellulaceae bacterium]